MVSPESDASPSPAREPRGERVWIRFSAEELAGAQAKAEAAGMTLSALVRDHLGKVRVRHRRDEQRRLALLNRINANLNMLSRWVNIHKGAADTAIVTSHLRAVEREITRLIATMERR